MGRIIVKYLPMQILKVGMVIQNHNQVHPAGFPIFSDIGQVTGVCLPHTAKISLFIGFSVFCRRLLHSLKAVLFDITLDS